MAAASIDTAGCGKTKGCYRDPAGCLEEECSVLATWKAKEDLVEFELSADTDGWVALGFSLDKKMVCLLYLCIISLGTSVAMRQSS